MSAVPRGPRGGRGPRNRGGGRGGANVARTKPLDGNESDASSAARRTTSRGRGRGTNSQNNSRGIAQAFQQVTRQQNSSRGTKTPRGGSRAATPSTNGFALHNKNETPEERWSRLKVRREAERENAVKKGLMSGSLPLSLDHAITLVGTCQDMCAEFERARRIYQKDVWGPEMDTVVENGETKREVNEKKMVKKFQRSAAGIDEQLPSDLRPPPVLLKTCDYLFNELLTDEESLVKANTFIWDRTRAIRNDFSIQQVKKVADVRIAIECYEKIARYHILSLHEIGGKGQERAGDSYNWQQDREQLDKTLLSLLTYYENVKRRYRSPNEAEFRSYWILFQIGNFTASVEDRVQEWPLDILRHPRIRRALDVYAAASDVIDYKGPLQPRIPLAIAQQHWQKFWNLVGSKQTSYLMSCVCEIGFNVIRRVVLTTISMGYFPGGKREVQDWTMEKMTEVLGFDDEDTTRDFIEQSNLMIGQSDDGTQYLNLSTVRRLDGLPDPTAELQKQVHSWHLVERKRFGRSLSAVIAGMSFKEAKDNDMLDPDWGEETKMQYDQDDGLFVPEDSHEKASAIAKAPAALNPFASAFTPPAPAEVPKQSPFGASGQASSNFGQPTASVPFGKTSAPSETAETGASGNASPFSSTGSFGALPKSFSFGTPSTSTPSAPAPSLSSGPSNPFAALSSASKPLVNAAPVPPAASPSAGPFAGFTTGTAANSDVQASNPFASFASGSGSEKKTTFENPFTTPKAVEEPIVPTVQIIPPQSGPEQPKTNGEPRKPKVSFAFPPATEFATAKRAQSEEVKAPASPAATSPFTFSANIGANAAKNAPSPASFALKPVESVPATVPNQTPVSSFSFPKLDSVPSAPNSTPAQAATSKQSPLPSFTSVNPVTSTSFGAFTPAATTAPALPVAPPEITKHPSLSATPVADAGVDRAWEQARKTKGFDYLAEQLCCDADRGYFKQYVANFAHQLIIDAMRAEEIRKTNEEADQFRYFTLANRYGNRWKKIAVSLKGRRKRQEMKKRNAEIKQKRMSMGAVQPVKEAPKQSLEEDFAAFRLEQEREQKIREELEARRKERLRLVAEEEREHHTASTSATNSFDLIGQRHVEAMAPPARPGKEVTRGHHRSKTQPNALGPHNGLHRVTKPSREASPALSTSSRSSFSRASLINGGSLADLQLPFGKKASTMQSPYFRLKAAGFGPTWKREPNTTSIGAKRSRLSGDDLLSNGSQYDGSVSVVTATKRPHSPDEVYSLSSPIRPPQGDSLAVSFGSSTSSNGVYKRSTEDDDLLARARKLRKVLEEGEAWYKDEIEKDGLRRSQELRESQLEGQARSQADSPSGPGGEDLRHLPKFYSRASRFVPREEYGVRKEKKPEEPETKGKAKINGTKLSNGIGGRATSSRQMPPPAPPKMDPTKGGGTSWDDAIEL